MKTVRLEIEYHGGGFSGWARQPGLRTVEGELEAAIAGVLGESVRLSVAGRTDAGVHARGQVASFLTSAEVPAELSRRLNAIGPRDIAVTGAAGAEEGFDARHDAKSRTYCYRILNRTAPSPFERDRALWWPRRIDRDVLDACAAALNGSHDFTAFTPTQTYHVHFQRNILDASWSTEGEVLCFAVRAEAFMHNMVRVLVGTMLEASSGRRSILGFTELLAGAPRAQSGDTAPAHGLHLESVSYA
jgi:tRNA pseudouridine38-40 synthase